MKDKREAVKKTYDEFINLPLDTTPERIKYNRDKLLPFVSECDLVASDKDMAELKKLLYNWYHYFDEGFKSKYSIDELPDLIKKSITKNYVAD